MKTEKQIKEERTCEQCGEVQEMNGQIVTSMGKRVCLQCKEDNRNSERVYDNWVTSPSRCTKADW